MGATVSNGCGNGTVARQIVAGVGGNGTRSNSRAKHYTAYRLQSKDSGSIVITEINMNKTNQPVVSEEHCYRHHEIHYKHLLCC